MALLNLAALGAVGYVAYRAWQQREQGGQLSLALPGSFRRSGGGSLPKTAENWENGPDQVLPPPSEVPPSGPGGGPPIT
jgi:hypothetical protein